jgi:hypothetical protein
MLGFVQALPLLLLSAYLTAEHSSAEVTPEITARAQKLLDENLKLTLTFWCVRM